MMSASHFSLLSVATAMDKLMRSALIWIGAAAVVVAADSAAEGGDAEASNAYVPVVPVAVAVACGVAGAMIALGAFKSGKKDGPPKFLPVDDYVPVPLIRKEILSRDTCKFTFGLPSEQHVLGLPIGQHLSLKFTDPVTNKAVMRSYTPVTDSTFQGEVSLVIKVYKPLPPKFPDGGAMSQYVDSLSIGDTILVRGPKGHVDYKTRGEFAVKPLGKPREERSCRHIGMISGGTGITPMLQIIQEILINDVQDTETTISLLYANQTTQDILVRDELEGLASRYPDRFRLWYTVDKLQPSETGTWKYDTGFVSKDMIAKYVALTNGNKRKQQFFMCGPPPMIKYACIPNLQELGFTEKDWVVF